MHRYQHIAYGNQNKTLQAASALRRRCDGQDDMTLAKLIEICKESGLPVSPLAVTRLELNCQLFTRIGECINEYRDVQQLHLDRNRISRIENLTALQHLRCLYLQGNAIRTIEGLDGLSQLQLLNLSGNSITRLSGLDRLPRLEALLVSDNRLSDGPSIQHLAGCSAVCELDLANNQLGDAEAVLQVLAAMPSLQTLTLAHNPMASAQTTAALQSPPATHVTSSATEVTATSNMTEGRIDTAARGPAPAPPLAFYRRTVVARCPHLTALDHRAVFPQERRYAEAWWQENQQRLREQQYQELGGSADHADQRSMVAGTAASLPPDGANLPTDVVYPVFTRLDARTLAVAALSCRSWAAVAAFPLSRQRLSRAQAALCDAAVAVPRLAAAIVSVQRDELDELLLTSGPPARPLVQLFFALEVLWGRYLGKRARQEKQRRQSCLPPPQQPQQPEQACLLQDRWQLELDELRISEQPQEDMQQHPAAVQPGGANSRQRSRNTSSSDSSVSKASGREACEPDVGEVSKFDALQHLSSESALSAQPLVLDCMDLDLDSDLSSDEGREEISDLDPEPVDLDSQTWRMASWEVAVELLRVRGGAVVGRVGSSGHAGGQDRDFPLPAMLTALPLGPRALAALRCRTGSADDLGFYVPQLRTQDVARLNASAGKLAEWLLGVEAHCRAAHEADQARAWSWPRRMTEKHEAIVVSETRQRGLIDGYQTVEADGRTVASDARGIGHENQGQTGADEAASGGGGAGGAVRSCEEPCDGACAIEKGEPRDAGLEMGENTGSGRDVQTRGSADGWDGITGVQHVGYLGEAGRDGRWRWPSAAAAARSMRECVEALLEERRAAAMARAAAEAEARAAAAAAAAAVAIAGTTAAAVPTVMQLVGEPRALSSADPLRTEWGMAADLGIRIRSGMSRPCFAEAEDWEPDLEDSESDATSSGR